MSNLTDFLPGAMDKATEQQAREGLADNVVMTPATTREAIDSQVTPHPPPPTGYGEIGTYVIAGSDSWEASTEYLPGGTVAGSSLVRSMAGTTTTTSPLNAASESSLHILSNSITSLGLTGSWRLMTRVRTRNNSTLPMGLFVRIA